MKVIVQKYGGSSVADPGRLRDVARLVKQRRDEGFDICVVVSAMGRTTDALVKQAQEIHPDPPRRELDMLLTCGERASMALLAMALDQIGVPSISFTGSQSGIVTDDAHTGARIIEVRPFRVQDELRRHKVVIVAGFQGVSYKKEITTLGRGGSDTTAVALAAALDADACEIYSDVDGVYTADPRIVPEAKRLDALSYEEMQELALSGAKVLNPQAVEFAKAKNIAIYARQTGGEGGESVVRRDGPKDTLKVRGIAHLQTVHTLRWSSDELFALLMHSLQDHDLSPMHIATFQTTKGHSEGVCVINPADAHGWSSLVPQLPADVHADSSNGTVSIVGDRLQDRLDLVREVESVLLDQKIERRGFFASSSSVTLLVEAEQVAQTAQVLHHRFIEKA